MGTRGFQAWRFRKRYYFQYNHWNSFPEGLGKIIVASIPSNPEDYQTWLEEQRKLAAGWEAEWNDYLTVDPDNEVKEIATEMMAENHPTWFAPLNDLWIEWVYILDLDREIFSVNNGAHFKLDQVRHVDWIRALADGCLGDKLQLLPEENVPSLLAKIPGANGIPGDESGDVSIDLEKLSIGKVICPTRISSSDWHANLLQSNGILCSIITPKNIADIQWRRRHGPVLRSCLFWLWSRTLEDKLAATLLQWSPEDPPFREIAFAILCLVSGGKNIAIVPNRSLKANQTFAKFGTEIISGLTTGAHVSGGSTGSSPAETKYWLDGVLVVLTTQLYRQYALELEFTRVAQYCRDTCPDDCVDAVLISIEHVVLVHIIPDKELQYSDLMPLINIGHHLSMDARSRYSRSYLDKLAPADGEADEDFKEKQKKKLKRAAKESMAKNEGIIMHDSDSDENEEDDEDPALYLTTRGVEGDPNTTFYALTHLFDAAARRRMPPVKPIDGQLPNEIYARILTYVTDPETRFNCMEVSRLFRQLCQEDVLFTDQLIFEPCEEVESCVEADELPSSYDVYDLASDERHRRSLEEEGGALSGFSRTPSWAVLIGTGRNRRSFLPNLTFKFEKVVEKVS